MCQCLPPPAAAAAGIQGNRPTCSRALVITPTSLVANWGGCWLEGHLTLPLVLPLVLLLYCCGCWDEWQQLHAGWRAF